jgi:hypothetical protein
MRDPLSRKPQHQTETDPGFTSGSTNEVMGYHIEALMVRLACGEFYRRPSHLAIQYREYAELVAWQKY